MRTLALVVSLALLAAPGVRLHAQAQERAGLGSRAEVQVEGPRSYRMDGRPITAPKLLAQLVELDRQMAVGSIVLRAGKGPVTAAEREEIGAIATRIGAELLVEQDGRLVPAGDAP